ncbi:MAG TPA: SDR family NAD(P)-dependent oxidoreductase, partial [Clostridia bacterium]|nr:SDR family NAD(P)-dependent oxidoreductase [Clostridia bacterium]
MNVRDKGILITGAAGGLGSEMARLLCAHGAQVVIADLDEEKGRALARELAGQGSHAHFVRLDVTREEDWHAAVRFAVSACGRLDVLVNNAGINIRKPVEE